LGNQYNSQIHLEVRAADMNDNDKGFDLPRLEGEDIFDYLDRYAERLRSIDYGPDGNLARDMLVATTIGDFAEADRIRKLFDRKVAARMKVIK